MQDYDVAIIGGGIAGLSLAYFLAPHRSVVVIEREEGLGYHSTGRSAAEFVLRYNAPEVCALAAISKGFSIIHLRASPKWRCSSSAVAS